MPLSDAEKAALVAAENDVAAADADVSAAAAAILAAAQDLSTKQASLMANTDALGQLIQALTPDAPAPSDGGSDPSSGGDTPPPPDAITGLTATVVDGSHIKVSWDAPDEPPADGWVAGRDGVEVGGGTPNWSGPIAGIATSITFGNLAPGFNYTFTITNKDTGATASVQASIPLPSSGGSNTPSSSGGGTPASGTVPAPPAPAGRRLFLEDFSVAAAVGEYVDKYSPRGWNFYPGDGGPEDRDTGHAGIYSTYAVNKTYSVANNRLTVRQYVENGLGLGGVMRRGENLTRGSRFGLCLSSRIISGDGRGLKVVPCMGWPEDEIWNNEVDGGECDDFSQPSKWKLLAGGDGGDGQFWHGPDNTGIRLADGKIHTIWWDWQDTFVGHMDDQSWDMGTAPTAPMQPLVQFEAWISSGAVPAGAEVETTIYWLYADQA